MTASVWSSSMQPLPAPHGPRWRRALSAVSLVALLLSPHLIGHAAGPASPPAPAQLPTGEQVVGGQATIGRQDSLMTIQQGTTRAAIDWQSFNIGSAAHVDIHQPSSGSVLLNRILGPEVSQIFGKLTANGQVFLSNPNGIYFAPSATVDVGGLLATTHHITLDDFMAGRDRFTRHGAVGSIVNEGQLRASLQGYIALLAPEVRNHGVIIAELGTVALAAGEAYELRFDPSRQLQGIRVEPASIQTLVENSQAVLAPGGYIVLSAVAAHQLQGSVVRNDGRLEASSLVSTGGRIRLEGDAITLGAQSITAATGATGGGEILVGGGWQGSGTMQHATTVTMAEGAGIDVSATQRGDGGTAVLWSDIHQPQSSTRVFGEIRARGGALGGHGGKIETSGYRLDVGGAYVDAGASFGDGGLWYLDPTDSTITQSVANSYATTLNTGTSVLNDVTGSITWNSGVTLNKTAGGDATLTLRAGNTSGVSHITLNSPSITSTSGALNLVLWTRYNSEGDDGRIYVNGGNIATNGGHLWMGGGNVLVGGWNGLTVGRAQASTWSYNVTGASIAGSSISTGAGSISINGKSAYTATSMGSQNVGAAVYGGSTLSTTSGDISINGSVSGVYANGAGTVIGNAPPGSTTGNVLLSTTSGNISISGSGSNSSSGSGWRHGVLVNAKNANEQVTVRSTTGNITLDGQAQFTSAATNDASGLQLQTSGTTNSIAVVSERGDITLRGSNTLESGQYLNGLRLTASDSADNIRIGYDGTTPYSGNILIETNSLLQRAVNSGAGSISVRGTGSLTIRPVGASFTQLRADTGSLSFDNDWNFGTTLSGFTLGKAGNTFDLTLSNLLSVAGPIALYGGNITLNGNLTSTQAGAGLLVKATGNIVTDTGRTLQTNQGALTLWSDSDATGGGAIQLGDNNSLNTANGSTSSNLSGGGTIVLAGGADNGANGGVAGDGVPDGYASSSTGIGVKLGATRASTMQMWSGGGDIVIRGASTASSGSVSDNTGIHQPGFFTANAGTGAILMAGTSTNFYGLNFGDPIDGNDGLSHLSLVSSKASGTAISLTGTSAANHGLVFNYNNPKEVLATGGGSIAIAGTGAGSGYGVYLQNQDLLATTGAVQVDGGTKGIYVHGTGARLGGKAGSSITASSSNVTLTGDVLTLDGTMAVNTTGTLTVQPFSTSFSSALSWPRTNLSVASGLTGLTLGKAGNTADITVTAAQNINGPIALYGGNITLNAGLATTNAGTGNVAITAGTGLTGNGSVGLADGRTMTVSQGGTSTYSGVVSGTDASFVKDGSGTLTLTGTNLYSGPTTVSAGTLAVGNGGGTGVLGTGAVTTNAALTFNRAGSVALSALAPHASGITGSGTVSATAATDLTVDRPITVAGAVALTATGGNLAIDRAVASSGGAITLAAGGTLTDGPSGALTAPQLAITGGTVTLDSSSSTVGTLAASGVSNLRYRNSGALTLGSVGATTGITASGDLDISTATGDLTVAAATTTSATSASALVLNAGRDTAAGTATGGNLLISGSPTISVGSGGRATLYSGSVSGSTGLTTVVGSGSGRFRYHSDEAASNFTAALGSGRYGVYREQPSVTVTATNQTMTYGGSVPTFTLSATGVNGDTATQIFSVAPTASVGGSTSTSGHLTAGSHAVTASGGTEQLGYASGSSVVGTLTVNQKALTYTGTATDKVYDGATTASLSHNTSGIVSGDTVTVSGSGAFADKQAGVNKAVTITGLTVGGLDGSNYTLAATASSSATITPKTVTVSGLTAADKVYDGTTTATVSGSAVNFGGLVSGDNLTLSSATGTFATKHVGTGKTVTLSSTYGGTDVANYTITDQSTTTAAITPKSVTVSGLTAADKVYDGTTTATVSGTGSVATGVGSETLGLTGGTTATFTDANAGIGKTVTATGYSLTDGTSGGLAGNYQLSSTTATTTAAITPKTVTVSGLTAADKVYDGTTTATVTGTGSVATGVGSETLGLTGGMSATFSDRHAGTGKTVTATGYSLADGAGGGLASNYQLSSTTATTTAAITPKTVTVSGLTAADKVYDGTTTATVSGSAVNFGGLVSGDNLTLAGATGTFATKHVGTGKTVTLSSTYGGTDAANYTITDQSTTTAAITPKSVTVSGLTAADKVYDGTTTATVTGSAVNFGGLVSGDNLTLAGATGTFATKHVGTGKTVTLSSTYGGTDAANYTITDQSTTTAAITPKAVTVSGLTAADKVYDGTTAATVTGTGSVVTGVGSETLGLTGGTTATFTDANAGIGKTVTATGYSLTDGTSGGLAGNYQLSSTTATTTAAITPKALTIQANHDARFVTESDAGGYAGVTYSGLVNGETSSVLSGTLAITRSNVGTTSAGTYANVLLPSGLTSSNYAIAYGAGTYTIVPANQLLVQVANIATTYGTAPIYGITRARYLSGTSATIVDLTGNVSATGNAITITDGAGGAAHFTVGVPGATLSGAGLVPVGIHTIGATNLSTTSANFNHTVTLTGQHAVTPSTLTVFPSGVTKTYDGTALLTGTGVTVSGVWTGDAVSGTGNVIFATKNAGTNLGYTISGVHVSGADVGNYSLASGTTVAGTNGTIARRSVTVSGLTAANKPYDGTTTATVDHGGATFTNIVPGDELTAHATVGTFADAQVGVGKTVALSGTLYGGADLSNYTILGQASTTADITGGQAQGQSVDAMAQLSRGTQPLFGSSSTVPVEGSQALPNYRLEGTVRGAADAQLTSLSPSPADGLHRVVLKWEPRTSSEDPEMVYVSIPRSLLTQGSTVSFTLPDGLIQNIGGTPDALSGPEGAPLPAWLTYDTQTATFHIEATDAVSLPTTVATTFQEHRILIVIEAQTQE